jgi:hypothetical protein
LVLKIAWLNLSCRLIKVFSAVHQRYNVVEGCGVRFAIFEAAILNV